MTDRDNRAPDDKQLFALAQAEEAGTLPDNDRRSGEALVAAPDEQSAADLQAALDRASVAPPTGVRSPATREIDLNVPSVPGTMPGTPIPPVGHVASSSEVPHSVHTPAALVPLDGVHPSTVEAHVAQQQIPDGQIQAIYEGSDGARRDALGHLLNESPRVVPPKTTGEGFE